MNSKHETRPIKWIHSPGGETLFSERAIIIEIVDESGGEFVTVKSQHDDAAGEVRIDADEWPTLWPAIDHAINQCREEKKPKII